jgi:hypothetical protein
MVMQQCTQVNFCHEHEVPHCTSHDRVFAAACIKLMFEHPLRKYNEDAYSVKWEHACVMLASQKLPFLMLQTCTCHCINALSVIVGDVL